MLHVRGTIEQLDEDFENVIERGILTFQGATATVREWDRSQRRYVFIDKLTKATARETKDFVEVTGVSQFHTSEIGLSPEDARIRLRVTPKGCKECR